MYLLGQNWETKECFSHDNSKRTSTRRKQDFILLGYNGTNVEQGQGLKKRPEYTFHYSVELQNIEDDEGKV